MTEQTAVTLAAATPVTLPDAQTVTAVRHWTPHLFSFRWTQAVGEIAREGNSLLVTFELERSGDGTRLRMTETGFREMGWEVAVLEEQYREHVQGWEHFLPRVAPYAEALGAQQSPQVRS